MSALVCPAEHKHGKTRTCYVRHACRCQPCKDRNRNYEQDRKAQVLAARKAHAYTKPGVTTSQALVEVTLSARDAEMLATCIADRARLLARAAQTSGVQAPILRTRAHSMHDLAQQLHSAAERIRH